MNPNICSGCGVCAGICPAGCTDMKMSNFGEYLPSVSEGCRHCGLCSRVCPFENGPEADTALKNRLFGSLSGHNGICGHYAAAFKGFDENLRQNAASGGLATYFLSSLLEQKAVDHVVCAGRRDERFLFSVADTPQELESCMGSVFCPLEASGVVRYMLAHRGTYAVIGLPCLIKALRKAVSSIPSLNERIKIFAGLVCGHQVTKSFTEFMAACGGVPPASINRVVYHAHDGSFPAFDYALRFEYTKQDAHWQAGIHLGSRAYELGWSYFPLRACSFCDDIYADFADIVFMDAWLPELKNEKYGTSLVLVRDEALLPYFRGKSHISPADISDIIASQSGSRVIAEKSERTAVRALLTRRLDDLPLKDKKVNLSRLIFEGLPIALQLYICGFASRGWQAVTQGEAGFNTFYTKLMLLHRLRRLLSLPYALFYYAKTSLPKQFIFNKGAKP